VKQRNNFDILAPVYDVLARLVFGNSIDKAQRCHLDQVPVDARVLILGGGTGKVLTYLLRINPSCTIVYYEASGRMISKSRARLDSQQQKRVTFIHAPELHADNSFDVVVTQFFLDLFTPAELKTRIEQITAILNPDAQWIAADFVNNGTAWQRLLLKSMYTFFRMCCSLDAKSLPPWHEMISAAGWREQNSERFYAGFIESVLFERTQADT
jgi:ubiquinone/menaquinone biosynthesis C-methylase UbiE